MGIYGFIKTVDSNWVFKVAFGLNIPTKICLSSQVSSTLYITGQLINYLISVFIYYINPSNTNVLVFCGISVLLGNGGYVYGRKEANILTNWSYRRIFSSRTPQWDSFLLMPITSGTSPSAQEVWVRSRILILADQGMAGSQLSLLLESRLYLYSYRNWGNHSPCIKLLWSWCLHPLNPISLPRWI